MTGGSKTISRERRAILRDAMRLSVPVMLEEALGTVVGYADTAMVGRIGAAASAAVGMTATVTWLSNSPLWAMGVAVMAVISRRMGAGDEEGARRAGGQAVWLALVTGALLTAVTVAVSGRLPVWMGADVSLHADASAYFRIVCIPMVMRAMLVILGYALRAAHEVRMPMLINIGVNVLNVILNRFLIFGETERHVAGMRIVLPGFGLGVRGAAVATAISVSLGGAAALAALFRNRRLHLGSGELRPDAGILKSFLTIGTPAMLTRAGTCLGHVVFASQVTRLGTTALAAHTLALTAEEAFYIPGYGMQTGVATLCGNALGAKDERRFRLTATTMMGASAAFMAATGLVLFLIPGRMMSIFTRDAGVIALGAAVLRMVALTEPLYGVGIILDGVFDGAGDTRVPLVCSVSTMWGVRILFTWICVRFLHGGLIAVWGCMVANNLLKTALEIAVFRSGRLGRLFGKGAKT